MTTRDEFEAWTRRRGGVDTSRDHRPDVADYLYIKTELAWEAWQARQQEIDALKAEIERLTQTAIGIQMDMQVDEELPELPPMEHPLRKLGAILTDLLDEDWWAMCEQMLLECWARESEIQRLKEWTEDDQQLPEDDEIRAARPRTTDGNDLYAEAMRLVGAKRSKYALIDLVNWLLVEARANALDAARYRYLRDPCSGAEHVIYYSRGDYGKGLFSGKTLDDVIDAAMKHITDKEI